MAEAATFTTGEPAEVAAAAVAAATAAVAACSEAAGNHLSNSNSTSGSTSGSNSSSNSSNGNSSNSNSSSSSRKKKQRVVTSTVEGYASLVLRGEPDLIEIKGMTFCGGLDKTSLSMENVPRHQQVLAFAEALCKALPSGLYAVACEHEHSCCVLLANTKSHRRLLLLVLLLLLLGLRPAAQSKRGLYQQQQQQHGTNSSSTSCVVSCLSQALGGSADFSGTDYSAATPPWAIVGSEQRGFDPHQKRVLNKGRRRKLARLAEAQQQEERQALAAS
ncbi:hypothetical protein ACSSS7_007523 [Eimeria intestinalis]